MGGMILRTTEPFIIVSLKALPLRPVETSIDGAPDFIPLLGRRHIVVSDGGENVIGDYLSRTPSMRADEVDGGVNRVLGVRHRAQSYQAGTSSSMTGFWTWVVLCGG